MLAAAVSFTDSMRSCVCLITSCWLSPLMRAYIFMCSMPVNSFHRISNWGHTPMLARIRSMPPVATMDSPWTRASPPVGGRTPVRQLIVVVLPAPFGPRRQKMLSSLIENHEPLMAQKSVAPFFGFFRRFFLNDGILAAMAVKNDLGNIFCSPTTVIAASVSPLMTLVSSARTSSSVAVASPSGQGTAFCRPFSRLLDLPKPQYDGENRYQSGFLTPFSFGTTLSR
mmetsp:Transcript_12482/g.35565  ORF Transcript_12482/g.35565 Transcript_12482/m.35565 type:complete len:226 (+) Transcript_12482:966-1643(+)